MITSNGQVLGRAEYYRENIVKKFILNDKNDSDFGGMFQHDQARAHMATPNKDLLDEYNINVIQWSPKGTDLNPIELCFGEIQR